MRIRSAIETETHSATKVVSLSARKGLKRKDSNALPEEGPLPTQRALAPAPGAASDPDAGDAGDGDDSSSESSSDSPSSSSSSSSSGSKKKKNSKKKGSKKQKKKKQSKEQKKQAAAKAAAATAKAEAKHAAAAQARASSNRAKLTGKVNKHLPKLTKVYEELKAGLADHQVCFLPERAMNPIRATFLLAETVLAQLRGVLSCGDAFPDEDVAAAIKEVARSSKELSACLKVLRRAGP